MAGKQRHHGQHDTRKKTEHRDRLKDVEQRNHDALSPGVIGGDVSVNQGEGEREDVSNRDAQQGIGRVDRKHRRTARDFDVRIEWAKPGSRQNDDHVEERQTAGKDEKVGDEGPGLSGQQRPWAFAEDARREPGRARHQPSSASGALSAASLCDSRPVSES